MPSLHKEAKYQHYIKAAQPDPDWKTGKKFVLIESMEELEAALSLSIKALAVDTETHSLSYDPGKIAGFSFAHSDQPNIGYYAPINHTGYEDNLPYQPALDRLYGKLRTTLTIYWNYLFDAAQIEAQGYDLDPAKGCRFIDAMITTWLLDTNWARVNLKWAESHFLGWERPHFTDVLGGAVSLAELNPKEVLEYAAMDAIGTITLANKLVPLVGQECKRIQQLDCAVLFPMMRWTREKIDLDIRLLNQIELETQTRVMDLESQIFALAGEKFDIASPTVARRIFLKLGLNTGVSTETTRGLPEEQQVMSTAAKAIEGMDHPLPRAITEWRSATKSASTYTGPLRQSVINGNNRFSYKPTVAATGRFSGGDSDRNPYFSGVSPHNLTKPHALNYYVMDEDPLDDPPDVEVLGYRLKAVSRDKEIRRTEDSRYRETTEGFDPHLNIRRAFYAPEGFVWVSADYAGEEMRLAANLSGDRALITAYLNNEDVHSKTCLALFGKINRDLRKIAKVFNFAVIYGASEWGLSHQLGMSVEECRDLLEKFWKAYPGLHGFIRDSRAIAQRRGTITTWMGRPRRLRYWYAQEGIRNQNAGDRRAFNSIVQGSGAEILKVGLCRIHREIYGDYHNRGLMRWRSTVHDEVNFLVAKTHFSEITRKLLNILIFRTPEWPVPLNVGLAVGDSWGGLFDFDYSDPERFILQTEPIKEAA